MVKKIEKIHQIQRSAYNSSNAHQKSHYDKIEIRGKSDKFQRCHSIRILLVADKDAHTARLTGLVGHG